MKETYIIVISAACAVVLLTLVMIVSYQAFERFEETAEMREQTVVVLDHADDLLSELKDAETGQRGYLLTADKAFLEPYLTVHTRIKDHLKTLRQLNEVKSAQQHLDALMPLVDAKLAELAHTIELRQHYSLTDVLTFVNSESGKRLMDSIRAEIGSFIQIETDALTQQETAFQLNMRRMFTVIVTISQLTLLFAFAFVYLIYREKKHQLNKRLHLETQYFLAVQMQTNKLLQQANVDLQFSEERLAVTLNSIGDAVIATDLEGRVTLINSMAEQLTGWTQADAIGRPVADIFYIINQETRQPTAIPVIAALAHGEIQAMTNHTLLIAHDGSECIIADSCAPIRGNDRQVIGAVLVFRDVTKDSVAKQAIRDSATLVQAILNTVPDGIITFNACGGLIETINPATEQMFGYNAEELIGQNFSLLIPELDEGMCKLCLGFNEKGKIRFQQEVIARRKNGSNFPLEIVISEMWLSSQRYFTGILRDITARKQAIEEGQRFFILSQEIQCITGFDGYFKSLNAAWEKTLGYTREELYAKPFIEYIHPDDRQASLAVVEELRLGNELISFENRFVCKDGSYRWFLWSATASVKEGVLYGSARDITERKISEIKQNNLYEQLQLMLDAGQLGEWNWCAASNLVALGTRAAQMYGFPEGALVTREKMRELLSPEDTDHARNAWDEALVTHTSYNNEYRLNPAVGEQRWVAMTGRGNYADDGTIIGMSGVMQDITERKLAEEKIRENDRRFRDMIDALPIAIYTTDAEGFVTYFNPAAVELCGRVPVLGVDQWCISWKLFLPDGTPLPHDQCPMAVVLKEGVLIRGAEAFSEQPDGTRVLFTPYPTALFDTNGKLVGGINVLTDITERRRAELELINAKLVAEKANLAKSEFLSSMSHELRTPLNAILGFAQLLEVSHPSPTAVQMLRLQEIIKAGWYLLALINEILDLALIESGKLSLSIESVSLVNIMLECEAMIEPQAQQHSINVAFLSCENNLLVCADRTRLKQVLLNLLSNAIKYNREHGTVEVTCDVIPKDRVRISVKDSGVGVSSEKFEQLFQPFNRLGQEYGSEEGTGIGLVVTKKLVELMDGKIGVESNLGIGSVFWIDLPQDVTLQPVIKNNTLPMKFTPRGVDNMALRTLLYVEDNPANLMLVEQIIADHPDIRMLSAPDGSLGIALARGHIPDVILMDINLPGITGFQALKILRKDPITKHMPVIAISANAMSNDIEKGLAAGFFRYLTKPIKVNEFMDTLNEALKFSETQSIHTIAEERI